MKRLLLIPLLLALFALTGCERYAWHQKLTVTVETLEGEVSASSVSAVSWRKQWIRWDGMGWYYDLTGEAVVVEVTPGRYLFALRGPPPWAGRARGRGWPRGRADATGRRGGARCPRFSIRCW